MSGMHNAQCTQYIYSAISHAWILMHAHISQRIYESSNFTVHASDLAGYNKYKCNKIYTLKGYNDDQSGKKENAMHETEGNKC